MSESSYHYLATEATNFSSNNLFREFVCKGHLLSAEYLSVMAVRFSLCSDEAPDHFLLIILIEGHR